MTRTGTFSILCLFVLLFTITICGAQQYTILDLGTLGGSESSAYGINNSGQVVGDSYLSGSTMDHGFRTQPNKAINPSTDDLGSLVPDRQSHGYAINDSGQVAGMANLSDGSGRAFRTAANSAINPADDLGIPYSTAVAINNSGQVAGHYVNSALAWRPFRTAANATTYDDLGSLDNKPTFATGMNNLGQVVGYSDYGSGIYHAFRTTANGVIDASSDLGSLGGTSAYANAINDLGQVVGHSATTVTGEYHAFRTAANAAITGANDLGTLGGCCSYAYGINKSGEVVGYGNTATAQMHAFVWTEQSGMKDLNSLVPSSSNWFLSIATAVNDKGQIAGYGYPCADRNCEQHAFLLTPALQYAAHVRPPIDADESSIFSAKRGVVPVKFVLTENGAPSCSLPSATISVNRTTGGTLGPIDEGIYLSKADTGSNFRIDLSACQYVYNLSVSSLSAGKYRADINIDGTSVGYAMFELK